MEVMEHGVSERLAAARKLNNIDINNIDGRKMRYFDGVKNVSNQNPFAQFK